MIPLLTTVFYNLPNPDSKIQPAIGTGISLLWKADHNQDFAKTHYSATYGFHLTGRLNIDIGKERFLILDLTYNLLMPSLNEDMNLNGILMSAGIRFPLRRDAGK
jgi:hypothetical protein